MATAGTSSHSMKSNPVSLRNVWLPLAAVVSIAASAGCTSVISSAYLREAWLDAVEHAAETTSAAKAKATDTDAADTDPTLDTANLASERSAGERLDRAGRRNRSSGNDEPETAAPPMFATLDDALADADRRLVQVGGLSTAARAMLVETLAGMPKQDWPVVIEEFAAVLAATSTAGAAQPATQAVSFESDESGESALPEAVMNASGAASPVDVAVVATVAPAQFAATPPPAPFPSESVSTADQNEPAPIASPVGLSVQNACFVSRVRGWGVVDRFETRRFHRGQELIVYFELDQLESVASDSGHTTRINTVLRLVGDDGRRIHEWTFEPLEETCRAQRRDYFARYLLTVPESAPIGACRLEVVVSDAIAGRTAHAALPLDIDGSPVDAR